MKVILGSVPASIGEFKAMPQAALASPEDTAAMLLSALALYVKNPAEGEAAMDLLRGPRPMNGFDKQFLRDRLRGKPYLPLAYFDGADPQNGYTPDAAYALDVLPDPRPQDIEEGYIRVYLKTAGADSPRPVKLRRKGDMWCLWEYSSVLSGIRVPKEEDPWG